jgi:hypothetical protein
MRVRFRAPAVAPERFLGTVRWLTVDSIALDTPDHRLAKLPREPITKMEISLGRSRMRAARRGLLWGTAVGAALGAFFTSTPCMACEGQLTRKAVIIDWMILSGVFGGSFGAANPSERWRRVALPTDDASLPR